MIDAASNPDRVHPDPFLRFIMPHSLELLLADGTVDICKSSISGHGNVLFFGLFSPSRAPSHGIG